MTATPTRRAIVATVLFAACQGGGSGHHEAKVDAPRADSTPTDRGPDAYPDVRCGGVTGTTSLYEAFCLTSSSGVCLIDHRPNDF